MRLKIISGSLGGRFIDAPKGHRTHPMAERVRGGLFSMLGDVSGLTVLDAFAGSGAIALEFISRGASKVVAIELDKSAHSTIEHNAEKLEIGKDVFKAIRANSSGWSDNNPRETFDIVMAAPPYDNLQEPLLNKLGMHVKNGGLYVLDWPGKQDAPVLEGLKLVQNKNYGDAQLVFYRKTS